MGKQEREILLGRPIFRLDDNINIDLIEIECGGI
jgi:hypothetical protein